MEAPIVATTALQWNANRTVGEAQQSTTVKIIFFVIISGFVELVIFAPFLINFKVCPPGNK